MISICATIVAAVVALPILIFTIECLLGLLPLPPVHVPGRLEAPPFAVLVPAHDESDGIATTVSAILAQLRPIDRLLVVADNCADDTAKEARSAGARVVERHDPRHIGKGYALAFGRDALLSDPPPVVIIIDADCRLGAGSLNRLALEAGAHAMVIQAAYVFNAPPDSNALVAISSFALKIRNVVRQRGLTRLRSAPLLQGTGMAFPWTIFSEAPLATDDIVEDLNLGIALLRQGHRIGWTETACVSSQPASQAATVAQRTRWEHGSTSSAIGNASILLRGAVGQRRPDMALLALDLIVPPLALLLIVASICWGAAALLALTGSGIWPVMILTVSLAAMAMAILLCWATEGRALLPLRTLAMVPLYVIWKLPIYVRLLTARERKWVRTARK